MELARNVVDLEGKPIVLDVVTGKEIKLRKDGFIKETQNNNKSVRTVDPIKDLSDIADCKEYLFNRVQEEGLRANWKNSRARDLMLFKTGINIGLRINDFLELKWDDVFFKDGRFKKGYAIKEQKTGKTRIMRYNDSFIDAVTEYIETVPDTDITGNDYVFSDFKGGRISDEAANKMIKLLQENVLQEGNYSTHTLRKTFGYHVYAKTNNLALVQELLNHSSIAVTRRYLGLSQEDYDEAYLNLNL